uniref:Acetyl-coenzyme A carboxylase carboxyl transferase subunit beta, chloroplastic n=1 Tax=Gracilaria vermiculophylla TaxID=2608709 RepID=A0A345U8R5_9FLOR|nr:acetyl-CoA carboxylase, carboxyl transferase subunit beta [Gracilaria vermiculophylla]AXI96851.1 acetyl-CoA carboxylase, carboxyl transferase subunit beta [Gracilaria vermiculophylla]QXU75065.1 acetyl-CoA carboxylase, carboxyl transferase subunit beta [Gracilaria vermiculophylla]WDZ67926.1 acetyl-CoA carboxylase, carboxyl transferase subunit beta [Gracilaria vermiculophylla]
MSLSEWLNTKRNVSLRTNSKEVNLQVPEGLWIKCTKCNLLMYYKTLEKNFKICPKCEHHFATTSKDRIKTLIDDNTWQPINQYLTSTDPLGFADRKLYSKRLLDMKTQTGLCDAVETGLGKIFDIPIALGIMDFRFMGGSMGSVVGEKLTRLIEQATISKIAVIIICASGGARMQEGMLSLMQMAKISSALQKHKQARLPYFPILTSPTTGGVTASFAMLGDLIIAEPNSLIAFAGRRVIEQTIKEDLPDNFQTSEYLFKHGFIDLIISRVELKNKLHQILSFYYSAS